MVTLNAKEQSRSSSKVTATKKKKQQYKPETVKLAFERWFVGEGAEDGDGNIRAFCPICEDPDTSVSPSAAFKPEDGIWNCQKGNHGGSIRKLAQDMKRETGWDIRAEAMKNRHKDDSFRKSTVARLNGNEGRGRPLPSQEELEKLVDRLMAHPKALHDLTSHRGFTQETIAKWSIGWDGERYTIPVRNGQGEVINVRRYKMNAARAQDKMLNTPGHGSAAIFGLSVLRENDVVVITEGETDCILLNQNGIPAVTHTAGAATFRPQWGPLFQDKTVFVCYDNDKAGRDGARKVKKTLDPFAEAVYTVDIPLDTKGADITDYLHKEGFTGKDFQELMAQTGEVEQVRASLPVPSEGRQVSMQDSMSEELQNETLELMVSIAGKQQEPYTAPKTIIATCDMSKGTVCNLCPISAKNGEKTVEMRPDDAELFRFVDSPEDRRKKLLREITGARCGDRVDFDTPENYHIEELLVQPSVDDRSDDESQTPQKRTAFSVSTHRSGVNEKRRIVGRNTADPKNGKLKFMAWKSEPVELDIDKFTLTEEDRDRLEIFQPDEDQTPLEKCKEIAQDLAQNVTHIYGRDILHVAYDLVFHSVLSFRVHDMDVDKGWLEMMVVGDTRTGKSDIAKGLTNHYRSGEMLSCEGMSFAGIVGGVQQIDNRWNMTWGAVPMNDRRLVVLDEVSGMKEKNIIEQMSSIRSSGIAQITKIQSEQTSARTRLIWITNPADGSTLAENHDLGLAALRSVVPNTEDIARFDFVTAAQKGEVDNSLINAGFSEDHDPTYTAEDCERLIKWVWSLTRDDVVISKAAAKAAIDAANDLGERYVADPPLIQGENVRYKVLRIAAALAGRTFSCDSRGRLQVESQHVHSAVEFLDEIYSQESMGYARKSRRLILSAEKARDRRNACRTMLMTRREDVLHTLQMVGGRTFRQVDFKVMGGLGDDEAVQVVRQLLEWRMVQMKSRGDIAMTPQLVDILRQLEDEED